MSTKKPIIEDIDFEEVVSEEQRKAAEERIAKKMKVRNTAIRWTFSDEKIEALKKEMADTVNIEEWYDVCINYNGKRYLFNVKDLEKFLPSDQIEDI